MSQIIQHYQTSFVIRNDEQSGENKLYQAQHLIGEWIKSHENKRFRMMGRDKRTSFLLDGGFRRRCNFKSSFSWCKTDYCIGEDSLAWAVRYTHRDADIRDVYWVSDIGLRSFEESKNLIVSVKISYKISSEYALTGQKFNPDVSIPWCVEGIVESFGGSKFYSGDTDVTAGIREAVTIEGVEQAQRVRSYMDSDDRKWAVVLLHGETKEVKREADYLSKNLFGKALVFIVPYKIEIKRIFGNLRLEFNECVFIPSFWVRDGDLAKKLRYFVTDKERLAIRHQVILHGWLGVHPINEAGQVSDIENVQLLIRRRQYFKLSEVIKGCVSTEEYEKIKDELKEMSGLFDLSEAEKKELEEKAVKLEDRVGELENRNLDLEIEKEDLKEAHATEVYNIKATHESQIRRSSAQVNMLPAEYPNSFEALRKFVPFFSGRVVFADEAWTPALKYREFDDWENAWGMLHSLYTVLWPLVFERDCDIANEYESRCRYGYARGEGRTTVRDNNLARMRVFTYDGKQYEMWAHIKYGNKLGEELRIHFAVDNERRRIIVGYIGEHMDNATTRTMH